MLNGQILEMVPLQYLLLSTFQLIYQQRIQLHHLQHEPLMVLHPLVQLVLGLRIL